MHTDRKIGFAMGILLIGIVAALFFRNEPLLSTRVSGVRRERELNQQLRERDVAVYLNDEEPDEAPKQAGNDQPWTLRDVLKKMDERNKTVPVPVGARSFAPHVLDDINDAELDGYRPRMQRPSDESNIVKQSSLSPGAASEQREPEAGRREFGVLPPLFPDTPATARDKVSPAVSVDEPGHSVSGLGPAPPAFDFQPPENFEEYVVKYGDTLSGIAERMLGAQNRYTDIYEANRDRMASPDRLEVGKPLRIPRVAENERAAY